MSASRIFPKEMRLRLNNEIRRVLKTGCVRRFQWVDVYTQQNSLGFSRLCVIISGKIVSAVGRNRVRRLFRESFRTSEAIRAAGLDIVVILRKWRPDITLQLAKNVLNAIIEK